MAHHEGEATAAERAMEVLSEEGLGGMAKAVELLLNEAMKLERAGFLGAAPHERTSERTGHAAPSIASRYNRPPELVKPRAGELVHVPLVGLEVP